MINNNTDDNINNIPVATTTFPMGNDGSGVPHVPNRTIANEPSKHANNSLTKKSIIANPIPVAHTDTYMTWMRGRLCTITLYIIPGPLCMCQ